MNIARSIAWNWDRILAWYKENSPPGTLEAAPGATERQLAEFESLVGTPLPDDFRESYRLVDGTRRGWLLYYGPLLSLTSIGAEWQRYKKWQMEPGFGQGPAFRPQHLESPEIKPVWWTPLRLPITDTRGGDHDVMLDLDPARGGTRGQIIDMSRRVGPISVLVQSRRRRADQPDLPGMGDEIDPVAALGTGMAGWLAQIADELASEVHAYSESYGMACPIAWGRL